MVKNSKKNRVAIIAARGGSTRIPKKNTIDFHGKPMIAWTIEAALKSNIFDKVIVGTDNKEIAKQAIRYSAEVPFLRKKYTDSRSHISPAVISILEQIKDVLKKDYETVYSLMANCPLRGSEDILKANKQFVMSKVDFQLSCFEFGFMNPWWAFKLEKGKPEPLFTGSVTVRSQDLPKLYCPTGAIWIANTKKLKKDRTFYGKKHTFFVMDWKSAIDIDDYKDLELAKAVFHLKR